MAAALLYAAMAGFAIPTQRALTMTLVVVAAVLARRNSDGLQALGIALIAILLLKFLHMRSRSGWSLSTLVALLRWNLFTYRDLDQWLDDPFAEPPPPPAVPEDVAAPPEDAERTDSGLASKVLRPGVGDAHPTASSEVTVHYSGWLTDGSLFDAWVTRGEPVRFRLNCVISGWTEGVQLMVVGEKRRFWIPEDIAYGGRPGAPQGMLVFDVELIEITEAPDPPKLPADVAAPPKDAEVTDSGLASKVLAPGTGIDHPSARERMRDWMRLARSVEKRGFADRVPEALRARWLAVAGLALVAFLGIASLRIVVVVDECGGERDLAARQPGSLPGAAPSLTSDNVA